MSLKWRKFSRCENSSPGYYFLKVNGLASNVSNILITEVIIKFNKTLLNSVTILPYPVFTRLLAIVLATKCGRSNSVAC